MKRALRYLKFISLGLIGTLVLIFLVNQIPTERDATVEETIKNYQPELVKNELAENPLYLFLQQNEPSAELMAVYAHLISTTDIPKLPPRMDVHKPIIAMFRWNKELLTYAGTHTEREKLKVIASIVDLSAKLLENRITIIEFKIFTTTVRQTLDWATEQQWSPKAIEPLKELSQKASTLLDKREVLVKNALNGERELSFQIVLDTDLSNFEMNLDSKSLAPKPQTDLQAKMLSLVGPYLFDRNQTLNIINTRFDRLSASAVCLQDYSCDKIKPEPYDINTFSMLRNPVGKGILKVLAVREYEMAKNQESFQKLEQSNKAFSAIL
jgi:hypothetical protein